MWQPIILGLMTIAAVAGAYGQSTPANLVDVDTNPANQSINLVWVNGGPFQNPNCVRYYGKLSSARSFYIGKYEVTQKEWTDIMGSNPSKYIGNNLPVEMVTWYECIDYCNKRSIKEGFAPYYNLDKSRKDPNNSNTGDSIKWTITVNPTANGYRLPTEMEWEYAASGGEKSRGYAYSGSDEVDRVAWYWENSGDKNLKGASWRWPLLENNHCRPKPVGSKEPNELGLYDMSGNVREFCWDEYKNLESKGSDPRNYSGYRVWKGGGWMGAEYCCSLSWRNAYEQYQRGTDQGFRVCRGRQIAVPEVVTK